MFWRRSGGMLAAAVGRPSRVLEVRRERVVKRPLCVWVVRKLVRWNLSFFSKIKRIA